MRTCLRVIMVVPRAVLLGFGTILQPKTNPEDHWSVSPKIVIVEESQAEDPGAPPWRSPDWLPRAA
jgi:hypothetical protein